MNILFEYCSVWPCIHKWVEPKTFEATTVLRFIGCSKLS